MIYFQVQPPLKYIMVKDEVVQIIKVITQGRREACLEDVLVQPLDLQHFW